MRTLTKNWRDHSGQAHIHTETKSKYFDGHGRLSQSKESQCMWAHDNDGVIRVFERCHQGVAKGMVGEKFKRRLSEVKWIFILWYTSSPGGKIFFTFEEVIYI